MKEPGAEPTQTPPEPHRLRYRLGLLGLLVAVACGALAWFTGSAELAFIALAFILVLSPLLATGLILLLHRFGLIDDEAAGRLGCLHGLGLLMLPVLVFLFAVPGNPVWYLGIPVAILSLFGIDVLVAMAFRLGLTKRRSLVDRIPRSRRVARPSVLRDPGRAGAALAVDAQMRVLRVTERERYSPSQAVGRLLLIATLPLFLVGVIGVMIALGGYDGTPLLGIGFVGGALFLAVGLLLGMPRDRR